jgi:putative ATPase
MPSIPLAERMRPLALDDYIGQSHIIGKAAPLRRAIESGIFPSIILWGPPGCGKTTLANLLAEKANTPFYQLSAINSGVKDVREVIEKAKHSGFMGKGSKPLLFIDEIHRFSKSQQDSLLAAVEKGTITLVGATTENPSFEVIPALLSRCQLYVLKSLEKEDLIEILERAINGDEFLKMKQIELRETEALLAISGGDARKLLNALELTVYHTLENEVTITNELVKSVIQQNLNIYDKGEEMHYDIVSAFIKSIRGSDPNAAVYWLARMIDGGEDPKFIARRLLILASEDVGNANPNALLLAQSTFSAVQMIGYPECSLVLSQLTIYLASSAKSNASYKAIKTALNVVKDKPNLPVPLHLRNAPTKLMKDIGYGSEYKYAHDYEGNFVSQEFLPDSIKGLKLFDPGNNARENEMRANLKKMWGGKYGY